MADRHRRCRCLRPCPANQEECTARSLSASCLGLHAVRCDVNMRERIDPLTSGSELTHPGRQRPSRKESEDSLPKSVTNLPRRTSTYCQPVVNTKHETRSTNWR